MKKEVGRGTTFAVIRWMRMRQKCAFFASSRLAIWAKRLNRKRLREVAHTKAQVVGEKVAQSTGWLHYMRSEGKSIWSLKHVSQPLGALVLKPNLQNEKGENETGARDRIEMEKLRGTTVRSKWALLIGLARAQEIAFNLGKKDTKKIFDKAQLTWMTRLVSPVRAIRAHSWALLGLCERLKASRRVSSWVRPNDVRMRFQDWFGWVLFFRVTGWSCPTDSTKCWLKLGWPKLLKVSTSFPQKSPNCAISEVWPHSSHCSSVELVCGATKLEKGTTVSFSAPSASTSFIKRLESTKFKVKFTS